MAPLTLRCVSRFQIRQIEGDPFRLFVEADFISEASPPASSPVKVSAQMQIWAGDNPTWEQLQLRAIDTLRRAFELPPELQRRLEAGYATDQTEAAQ